MIATQQPMISASAMRLSIGVGGVVVDGGEGGCERCWAVRDGGVGGGDDVGPVAAGGAEAVADDHGGAGLVGPGDDGVDALSVALLAADLHR
jgi:hypothetical protein